MGNRRDLDETENQRSCATCDHPRGYHPNDGACSVFSCDCRGYERSDKIGTQEYIGDPAPRWVVEGARVRVKSTPHLKKYGLRVSGGGHHDDRAWPGEEATLTRADGPGWWSWQLSFARGRYTLFTGRERESVSRVSAPKAEDPLKHRHGRG